MNVFPDDFVPGFNKPSAQESLQRNFLEKEFENLKSRPPGGYKIRLTSEHLTDTQVVNQYIEDTQSFLANHLVLLVEYREGTVVGSEATLNEENFRIDISIINKDEYTLNITIDSRLIREMVVKQLSDDINTNKLARVVYNLYEEAVELVNKELAERGWATRILRNYRGVNCNKGQLVFEVFDPSTEPQPST